MEPVFQEKISHFVIKTLRIVLISIMFSTSEVQVSLKTKDETCKEMARQFLKQLKYIKCQRIYKRKRGSSQNSPKPDMKIMSLQASSKAQSKSYGIKIKLLQFIKPFFFFLPQLFHKNK